MIHEACSSPDDGNLVDDQEVVNFEQIRSVVEAIMRSSNHVSLHRIAHCSLLRSELVCLIQTGPLSDHAIIQSAAVLHEIACSGASPRH